MNTLLRQALANTQTMRIKHLMLILLVNLISITPSLHSQNPAFKWVNQIGGTDSDFGNSITTDANVYTTGSFQGTAGFDPGTGTTNLLRKGF